MARLLNALRTQLTAPTSQLRPVLATRHHPHDLEQIRFKVSSRQTGGAKSKAGKSSENRAAQTKGYLKKPKSAGSSTAEGKSDRYEAFREMLYGLESGMDESARLARLEKAVPSYEMHETIDRAWKLNERHRREEQEQALERQYLSMNKALEELRLSDIHLYLKVIKDNNGSIHRLQNILQPSSINGVSKININSTGKLHGLFPRQLKLPVESLPNPDKVWDHDWINPIDPSC
ncbi:uncharacterized protein VP01_2087g10 [Puccinia sorghi]|uniref:Large ribosomal subunit protein mL40 n=1 Tax=Puccinia sorghi TaxID=27349 RepID=A0A0L6VAB6_9BASI|nr:uncharacterized protein VP01_2087g10 [Puccinia sorghi]